MNTYINNLDQESDVTVFKIYSDTKRQLTLYTLDIWEWITSIVRATDKLI